MQNCFLISNLNLKKKVVFDCAAKYGGGSFNDPLLRGPDFLNSVVSILCRFRVDKTAVVRVIEQMFHQVLVDSEDRQYLRFMGSQGRLDQEISCIIHLFGVASLPT